jgi:hypothetical protein
MIYFLTLSLIHLILTVALVAFLGAYGLYYGLAVVAFHVVLALLLAGPTTLWYTGLAALANRGLAAHPDTSYACTLLGWCSVPNMVEHVIWYFEEASKMQTYILSFGYHDPWMVTWRSLFFDLFRFSVKALSLCGAFTLGLYMTYMLVLSRGAFLWSLKAKIRARLVNWAWGKPVGGSRVLRKSFARQHTIEPVLSSTHSHKRSAGARAVANVFINDFRQSHNIPQERVFKQSMSVSEYLSGHTGDRAGHSVPDLSTLARVDELDADLVTMVDVDYYMDMPRFLSLLATMPSGPCPVLLWTFCPTSASDPCAMGGEIGYTFNEDQTLHMSVSGGAVYSHALWDYQSRGCGKSLTVSEAGCHVAYDVEVRRLVDDCPWAMIILCPTRVITPSLLSALRIFAADYLVGSAPLKRFSPASGGFISIETQTQDGLRLSVCKPGNYNAVNADRGRVDELADAAEIAGKMPTTWATRATLNETIFANTAAARSFQASGAAVAATAVQGAVHRHIASMEPLGSLAVETIESSVAMEQFANSFFDNARTRVPTSSYSSDEGCVRARIMRPRPVRGGAKIEARTRKFTSEFAGRVVTMLLNGNETLRPVDHDEVYERQPKPTQRAILEDAAVIPTALDGDGFGPPRIVSFQKAEKTDSDPRNITPLPGPEKMEFSRYVYAMAQALKASSIISYAFRYNPRELSEAMGRVHNGARRHLGVDASRMDGTITLFLRQFEDMILTGCFPGDQRLLDLAMTLRNVTAKTKEGVQWFTGTSRLSGTPWTSLFNSLFTKLAMYLAYRWTGHSAESAWRALQTRTLAAGDDGSMAAMIEPDDLQGKQGTEEQGLEWAYSQLGLKLKLTEVPAGKSGHDFLNRVFGPYLHLGDGNSMSAPLRALDGLTSRTKSALSDEEMLYAKYASRNLLDGNSPLFSTLFQSFETSLYREAKHNPDAYEGKLVAWLSGEPREQDLSGTSWFARTSRENQFTNKQEDWMWDIFCAEAEEAGVVTIDMDNLRQHLAAIDVKPITESGDLIREYLLLPPVLLGANFGMRSDGPVLLINDNDVVLSEGKPLPVHSVATPAKGPLDVCDSLFLRFRSLREYDVRDTGHGLPVFGGRKNRLAELATYAIAEAVMADVPKRDRVFVYVGHASQPDGPDKSVRFYKSLYSTRQFFSAAYFIDPRADVDQCDSILGINVLPVPATPDLLRQLVGDASVALHIDLRSLTKKNAIDERMVKADNDLADQLVRTIRPLMARLKLRWPYIRKETKFPFRWVSENGYYSLVAQPWARRTTGECSLYWFDRDTPVPAKFPKRWFQATLPDKEEYLRRMATLNNDRAILAHSITGQRKLGGLQEIPCGCMFDQFELFWINMYADRPVGVAIAREAIRVRNLIDKIEGMVKPLIRSVPKPGATAEKSGGATAESDGITDAQESADEDDDPQPADG